MAVSVGVGRFAQTAIAVLLGNGNGTFQAPMTSTSFGTFQGLTSAAVGDFNGDGEQDLATQGYTFVNIVVLAGNGDGTFQTPQSVGNGGGRDTNNMAVGDFNGDGKQDLAMPSPGGSGIVSVLLGNGDGTFQGLPNFVVGGPAVSVAVGDFNGDGRQDLATANGLTEASVSVLINGLPPLETVNGLVSFVPVGSTFKTTANATAVRPVSPGR